MSYVQTLAPALPLSLSDKTGYVMLTKVRETTRQNLKCLMLTGPGERVMFPEFGVGLKKYLFQAAGQELKINLKLKIRQQINKYMPFISVEKCTVLFGSEIGPDSSETLFVSLQYSIQSVGATDVLDIAIKND
tara:strand:- start:2308 stop:2706 length:399 start_codon:yes stop_codon:yes gene_type:complete